MTRLVAIVVAVAMLASVARAAGTANVSLSVIPNPLAVSLALDLPEAGVGEPRVATATVQNLGAAGLSGVTLSLRVDPIGVALRGGPSAPLFISGHSSVTATWNICGSSPGSYLLIASATVGAFRAESAAQLFQVNSGGGQCEEAASGTVSPGDSFSTDAEGDGAHPGDVVETGVTSPAGGLVEIVEQQGGAAPPGLTVLGWQVVIVAPPTTATHPLRIEVELDASLLPPGVDALTIRTRVGPGTRSSRTATSC
jgi:hypothetical protein